MTADATNIRCVLAQSVILDVLKEKYTLKSTLNENTTLMNYSKLIFAAESDCQLPSDDLYCEATKLNNFLSSRVTTRSTGTAAVTQTKDCSLSVTIIEPDLTNTISVGIDL